VKHATTPLTTLLARLKTYVVEWKFNFVPAEDLVYEPGIDIEEADLGKANVVSSLLRRPDWDTVSSPRHVVALDLDYPAYVVSTSTPGHHHVYLDVPTGVSHDGYMEILEVLGRHGVIEKGYAEVSIKRGRSDLRLPWVTKDDQKLSEKNFDVNGRVEGETVSPLPDFMMPF
jgi:hypothetical protein